MVERRFYSDHPPRAEYRLTDKGKAFAEVVRSMREFGEAWLPSDAQPPANSGYEAAS